MRSYYASATIKVVEVKWENSVIGGLTYNTGSYGMSGDINAVPISTSIHCLRNHFSLCDFLKIKRTVITMDLHKGYGIKL